MVSVPATAIAPCFLTLAVVSVSRIRDAAPSRGPSLGNSMAGFTASTFKVLCDGHALWVSGSAAALPA